MMSLYALMVAYLLFCVIVFVGGSVAESAEIDTETVAESILQREYDLAGERSSEPRYYYMETKVVQFKEDGTRMPSYTLNLHLMCAPAGQSPQDGHQYTCVKYTFQSGDEPEVRIPVLDGWSYLFKRTKDGDFNQGGLVLGIDHGKFQGLKDSNGNDLPPDMAYAVYNTFIDFHAFCNVFAERTTAGKGIQDLKKIGQKIVHASAFSEPSTQLASNIADGSSFKNGEVTLEFKGLSVVDDVPCAVVGFDSGDSSFTMIIKPTPDMEIKTVGASHYWGDLHIELESKWVRKVAMGELVVFEVNMGAQGSINSVMERNVTIRAVDEDEFDLSNGK